MKKGYFPLPTRVASMIACKLSAAPGATIFDPCAGEGDAVSRIARSARIAPECIVAAELDVGRSKTLRRNLPDSQVFEAVDFLGAFHHGAASITYCNPPFDNELGGGGRIEWRFIDRAVDMTADGGVVVIVIPESVAVHHKTKDVLTSRLDRITAFAFPESDRKFGEIAIFGVKLAKHRQPLYVNFERYIKPWAEVPTYEAAESQRPIRVRKIGYTEQELAVLLESSEASELMRPLSSGMAERTRSPMALRKGHIAMLLASGCMNGLVDTGGPDTHVVRGSSRKVTKTTEYKDDSGIRTVETERILLTVKAVTLSGEVVELTDRIKQDGDEVEGDDDVDDQD